MSVAPRDLSYDTHKYLSIILARSSTYLDDPPSLAAEVPGITHLGQLGVLDDVHVYSIPLDQWAEFETAKRVEQLRDIAGVVNVSVQVPTQREKRYQGENPEVIVNQEKIWTVKSLDAKEAPSEQ